MYWSKMHLMLFATVCSSDILLKFFRRSNTRNSLQSACCSVHYWRKRKFRRPVQICSFFDVHRIWHIPSLYVLCYWQTRTPKKQRRIRWKSRCGQFARSPFAKLVCFHWVYSRKITHNNQACFGLFVPFVRTANVPFSNKFWKILNSTNS